MTTVTEPKHTGLDLLREPFPPHQISKLPKPSKAQTDAVKVDFKKGIRCQICGTWHHPDVVHLDYVGHAALTDRLLDADPAWSWEPLALSPEGLPVLDTFGGMWIKLTVCGITRLGYGDAEGKSGGNAIKEVIGDALRNAAMRFGAALDLWHKGDLHRDEEDDSPALKQGARKDAANSSPAQGDVSPKARAVRLIAGVAAGDAVAAAAAVASWDQALIDEVWKHLDAKTADALNANWPKDQAA